MKKDSTPITTVDDYISMQSDSAQKILIELRKTIKDAAPEAEETISYGMPSFKLFGMLVYYAIYKNHYALYPMPNTIEVFKDKLSAYQLSKGTIQFPLDQPMPKKLITEIVKYRVKENLQKKKEKKLKKK